MSAADRDVSALDAALAQAREISARLEEAQELAKLGSWELDLVTQKLSWSREVFRIFEIDATAFDASYEAFLAAVHPADRVTVDLAYRQSVEARQPYTVVHRLQFADGRIKHVRERGQSFYDASGRPTRSIGTVQDITAEVVASDRLAESLREKDALLREIHHRVKNNLQVVSSLLYLQAQRAGEPRLSYLLRESRDRVLSMAAIHETLYLQRDLSRIDFGRYLERLLDGLRASLVVGDRVQIRQFTRAPMLPIEVALPCGLIVNELVTNALKHAFPAGGPGSVRVDLTESEPVGTLVLVVADDGVGVPQAALESPRTLGLQLVRTLVAQIDATLTVDTGRGTCFEVRIRTPTSPVQRGGPPDAG